MSNNGERSQKTTLQQLFEEWFDGCMDAYGESWGDAAVLLSTDIIKRARFYIKELGVKPTKQMKRYLKRGSL